MKGLDFWTDKFSMWGVVIIGIITTGFLGWSVSPELLSKIVLAVFAGGLPLISVRFLVKKKMGFFWMSVCIIVFSDVSMVLSLTEGQAVAVTSSTESGDQVPTGLKRLQTATDDAKGRLEELLAQQRDAKTVAFVQVLTGQIEQARQDLKDAQAREEQWKPEDKAASVSSHEVFMAIPKAVASGDLSRWMTLVYALLLAVIYQGTLKATTHAVVKNATRAEAKPAKSRKRNRPAKKAPKSPEPVAATEADFRQEPAASAGMTDVL